MKDEKEAHFYYRSAVDWWDHLECAAQLRRQYLKVHWLLRVVDAKHVVALLPNDTAQLVHGVPVSAGHDIIRVEWCKLSAGYLPPQAHPLIQILRTAEAVQEARLLAVPILATQNAAKEQLEDGKTGRLCKLDAASIADAAAELYRTPDLRQALREALRRHDFEHDNALILQKLYALL